MDYIYAPILDDTLIPGDFIKNDCVIYYKNPELNNSNNIIGIKVRLVNYYNNHILYEDLAQRMPLTQKDATIANKMTIQWNITNKSIIILKPETINNILSENKWSYGNLYKLQLCFLSEENKFSEWSNVIVIKCIETPTMKVGIQNFSSLNEQNTVSSDLLEVNGETIFTLSSNEYVKQYKFDLYDVNKKLIESSSWIYHLDQKPTDTYRFQYGLENGKQYTIEYFIESNNGYIGNTLTSFTVNYSTDGFINGINLITVDDDIYSLENGCISIYLETTQNTVVDGIFEIVRSSNKSNFKKWESLGFLSLDQESFSRKLFFTDFTIESDIQYLYALKQIIAPEISTNLLYEIGKPLRSVHLEYSYLLGEDNTQLKLKFNNKMGSFKHSVLANKVNTLSSKYPTILRNGMTYYAEFPITGLISFQLDENNVFLKEKTDGYYFQKEKVLSKESFSHLNNTARRGGNDNFSYLSSASSLNDKNIYLERIFRDNVEKFLNNGKYKLFRSPTEGNIIVSLMNIALQPVESLERMIYSFTSTAYEMADFNFENLIKLNIIKPKTLDDLQNEYNKEESIVEKGFKTFGQLKIPVPSDPLPEGENFFDIIPNIEEELNKSTNLIFKYEYNNLESLEIELYEEKDEQIQIKYPYCKLEITNKDEKTGTTISSIILIPFGEKYSLKNIPIAGAKIYLDLDHFPSLGKILINYVCSFKKRIKTREQDGEEIQLVSKTEIGQTEIPTIFKLPNNVNESFKSYKINNIYSHIIKDILLGVKDLTLPENSQENKISIKNFSFNITTEKGQEQNRQYKIENPYYFQENEEDGTMPLFDSKIDDNIAKTADYCLISSIIPKTIEANEYTKIILTLEDGTLIHIYIGPNEKYIFPKDIIIKDMYFEGDAPSYCLIDYVYTYTYRKINSNTSMAGGEK